MSSFLGMFYFNVEEVGTGVTLNKLNFKASCRLATTFNIDLPDPISFIFDGFALQEGERLLVRAQTNEAQNGIYKRIGNELFRTSDCDTWEELVMALVPVEAGNTWKGTFWLLYVEQGGTLEVDDIAVIIIASSKDMIFSSNFIRDGLSLREVDLSNTTVTPGTHSKVTVDQKGRVTAGGEVNHNDTAGKQGGTTNEYYHLTQEKFNTVVKHNFSATSNPTPADDGGEGYSVGSIWINVSTQRVYVCEDVTIEGAAVWLQIYPALHNSSEGLQGGTTNQYYHLTQAQHPVAANLRTAKAVVYPSITENNLDSGDWHKQMIITITKNDDTNVDAGEHFLVHLWFSKTDFGAPDYDFSVAPLSGFFTITLMQGKMISPETFDDKIMMHVLTSSGGEIVIEFEGLYNSNDAEDFIFLIVEVQGKIFSERFYLATGV